jgi:putative tricarboxylic transport membrane protein
MRTNDAVSGAFLILISVVMIVLTVNFPPFPGQKYGPALFPRLLGAGLIICGILLMIRGLSQRKPDDAWATVPHWMSEPKRVVSFLLMFGAMLLYVLASEQIGFLIISSVILAALFLWFQVKPLVAIPLAIASTWIIHWFFVSMMRVPLPRGILTNYI